MDIDSEMRNDFEFRTNDFIINEKCVWYFYDRSLRGGATMHTHRSDRGVCRIIVLIFLYEILNIYTLAKRQFL